MATTAQRMWLYLAITNDQKVSGVVKYNDLLWCIRRILTVLRPVSPQGPFPEHAILKMLVKRIPGLEPQCFAW